MKTNSDSFSDHRPLRAAVKQRFSVATFAALLLMWTVGQPAFSQGVTINEQNIREAVIGNQEFNQSELFELDRNADGQVDVADLVFFLSGTQLPLDGYQWLVSASFGSDANSAVGVAYSYLFALTVSGSGAVVSMLDQLNPTKDLLRQNLSGPGEMPGQHRPDYALSSVVPVGTSFTVTGAADGFLLTSTAIPISSANPINPTGVALARQLTLTVSTNAAFSDAVDHGTISDQLTGALPAGAPIVSNGTVRLTRYAPSTLVTLENPPNTN